MRLRVTAPSGLILRAGPSRQHRELDLLPVRTIVDVLERKGDGWTLVRLQSKTGWVAEQWTEEVVDEPATPAAFFDELDAFLRANGIRWFKAREVCPVGRTTRHHRTHELVALKAAPRALWPNAVLTLRVLDQARDEFGRIDINSGYRDPAYNGAVGSEPGSLHPRFNAFDARPVYNTPTALRNWIDAHPDAKRFGRGFYSSFVHIDTRALLGLPAPARW